LIYYKSNGLDLIQENISDFRWWRCIFR